MTKLLITENLITNKQDFIKLSNISEGIESVSYTHLTLPTNREV